MKFLRKIRGHMIAARLRNGTIWMELNVETLEEKVQRYINSKSNWQDHLSSMDQNAYQKCCINVNLRDTIVWNTHLNVGEMEHV